MKQNKDIIELENPVKTNLTTGETKTTESILAENKDIVIQHLQSQVSIYSNDKALVEKAVNDNKAIEALISNVLSPGTHFGFIPGTKTKSLFQPGADLLARTYGIEIRYELVDKEIDLSNDLIDYTYKAVAYFQGNQIGEADASANSHEQKFRGHYWDYKTDTKKKGKTAYDQKNTILQMAQKRAMVRVVRKILGITGAFTQDVEDMAEQSASNDDKKAVYGALYTYESADLGKNQTERRNLLKLKVLKPLCMELVEGRNMTQWTHEDTQVIIKKLDDDKYVAKLIKEAKNEKAL